MTNKFESKCLQKLYVSSKHEKEYYMKTTSYLEEPNHQFCKHFMRRTTQHTFSAINLACQQKTTKLFFPSQVRKQFKLSAVPFKSLRCCLWSDKLVNCHVWKFYKDLFLNCCVSSWPELSIKSYFLMVSSLILLRSLRVYILILGDPGAVSRVDKMFVVKVFCKIETNPWALTLTEPVPEAFELPASDWPEKFFSGQSAKRSCRVTLVFCYTT